MPITTTLGSRVAVELKEVARVLAERQGRTLSRYVEAALRAQVVNDLEEDRGRRTAQTVRRRTK